jgi:LacI family repressor for deo operon, udp, cdd, tsx, nupC, and nupG
MKKKSAKATITEVAQRAGVSIATVSRVLSGAGNVRPDTCGRVAAAAAALGYARDAGQRPARRRLAVVVLPEISNPFYAKVLQGIQVSAASRGLDTLVYPCGEHAGPGARLIALLGAVNACGCILLVPVADVNVLAAIDRAAPVVQCAEYNDQSPLPYVSVDDFAAARNAVVMLLERGCGRVALINGPERFKYARQRYRGYAEALREAGLAVNPALVCRVAEMDFESCYAAARQLLCAYERPDAILAASDMFAAAVVKAAHAEAVRIPEDCALIGFDNTFLSQVCHPSVTAVSLPQYQLGYMACEMLAERMLNPSVESRQVLLKTELVIRETTGDAR